MTQEKTAQMGAVGKWMLDKHIDVYSGRITPDSREIVVNIKGCRAFNIADLMASKCHSGYLKNELIAVLMQMRDKLTSDIAEVQAL
jgi:hypothetical protein